MKLSCHPSFEAQSGVVNDQFGAHPTAHPLERAYPSGEVAESTTGGGQHAEDSLDSIAFSMDVPGHSGPRLGRGQTGW